MQRSDAPARNVPGYWLGDPSSGWRWPFDATFTAWKVWALAVIPAFVLLWLIVPVGIFIIYAAMVLAAAARRGAPPIFVGRHNVTPWVGAATVALFAVGLTPNPLAWFVPLPIYLAAVVAPLLALFFARTVMPWIETNTPMSYWLRLLPRVAAGPRPRRSPRTLQSTSPGSDSDVWDPILLHALTIDPKDIRMPTATPRVQPVEFHQWLPNDLEKAALTVAWLNDNGFTVKVTEEDRTLLIDISGVHDVIKVRSGHYVILNSKMVGGITTRSAPAFEREYEVQA